MRFPLHPQYMLEINSYNPISPTNLKWQRTTTQQLKMLEAAFKSNKNPTSELRQSLSLQIKLPLRHVTVWFQNRRAKEKTRTQKPFLTKKARKSKGAIHDILQTQTEPHLRDETPHEEQEQLNVPLSPPLNAPLAWHPTPASYTPSTPESPIIADITISHWAENAPNPNYPPPDSRTHVLANTRSVFGLGLEDVSSVCSGLLPFTNASPHIHALDPVTFADECSQQLTPHADYINFNVNMEQLNGLSHSHSIDNRHDDMSTMAQYGSSTSTWYMTSSGSPSIPSFNHMRNSSDSISTPCIPIGLDRNGENPPSSPLSQTCSSGLASSINNTCYGFLAGNYGYVDPPAQSSSSGLFDNGCAEGVRTEIGPVLLPSPLSFRFTPTTPVEHAAIVLQTPDRDLPRAYFDQNLDLDRFPHEKPAPEGQGTNRRHPSSQLQIPSAGVPAFSWR